MSLVASMQGFKSVLHANLIFKLPVPVANAAELAQQTMIVTGANGGLGYEASMHLSRLGLGRLIMGVRTPAKGEEAKKNILAATRQPESSIEVWPIDMDSYDSIKSFASRASELPRLDGVLANAGIMTNKFRWSEKSESTLNVNVISTFLFYLLLLPKMRESCAQTGHVCRFVIPNSALHYMSPIAELDPTQDNIINRLNDEKKANMGGRYPLTKLLVLFAVREAAKRANTSKGAVIINTPNPSFCKSNLTGDMYAGNTGAKIFEKLVARTTEEGSRVLVHGLLAGADTNGQYLNNCHVETPAKHVINDLGQKIQVKFFDDLLKKLDDIEPGVSSNL
ncbi:hypothetical protein S7711_06500 [Stachybotrys chartarum IBT 7711]|uniref:Uncharacterized protein n=1 Tax=Stachybotrys chartarum (strain CBS 109288 / IBT 7711) TaxID=1280523 RepID=A0A084BB84_STACB|nr:hypothetical protein S7711_06500 [Stachybotrys chartarum IBT 7711]